MSAIFDLEDLKRLVERINTHEYVNPIARPLTITNHNADYTILTTDEVVRFVGTHACNLPAATGSGKCYIVKHVGASGTITVTPAGGDNIDGAGSLALAPFDSATLLDGGATRWDIL